MIISITITTTIIIITIIVFVVVIIIIIIVTTSPLVYIGNLLLSKAQNFEDSRPEWYISSIIYSRDTPFWLVA